jgi:hypothetical protein
MSLEGSVMEAATPVVKEIAMLKGSVAATLGPNVSSRLLPTGDLLSMLTDNISLHIGVTDAQNEPISVMIPSEDCRFTDLSREFSIVGGDGYSRDLLACAPNGDMLLSSTDADGTGTSFYQTMALEGGESVSCVHHAGDCYLLGTSSGELYVLRREGQELLPHRLQSKTLHVKPQNVFAGLFNTGVKLLGLAARADAPPSIINPRMAISHLLVVEPLRGSGRGRGGHSSGDYQYLLTVSAQGVDLWADWRQAGQERLLWTVGLGDLLLADVAGEAEVQEGGRKGGKDGSITILDVCLMPSDAVGVAATVLVLSAVYGSGAGTGGGCTMYLHVVAINADGSGGVLAAAGSTVRYLSPLLSLLLLLLVLLKLLLSLVACQLWCHCHTSQLVL